VGNGNKLEWQEEKRKEGGKKKFNESKKKKRRKERYQMESKSRTGRGGERGEATGGKKGTEKLFKTLTNKSSIRGEKGGT